jgi:hypothetical protein
MKLLKLVVTALFTLGTVINTSAQDENNSYVVGFGVNVINLSDNPIDTDSYNFLSNLSRVSYEKYLEKGFTIQLAGTVNSLTTAADGTDIEKALYWSTDLSVKYDLNNLLGETTQWFDPYVFLGGSYVNVGDLSEGMLNSGAGFNTWFSENMGLNLQLSYRKGFSDEVAEHWQPSLGLVYRFGE